MKNANSLSTAIVAMLAVLAAWLQTDARAAGASCTVHSTKTMTPVVELYTSEGCSSCPPADRWLSRLKADPDVVALAFHVDYWDRLGWTDRFASPAYTRRQAEQQASNGARFSYTPQIVVDGADRKDWPGIAAFTRRNAAAATVALTLVRDGAHVSATVVPTPSAPKHLAAYWAVTEQGYVTAVKAGENDGATLQHDYVVRDYRTVAPWPAQAGVEQTLAYDFGSAADATHPRALNLVVVDAGNGRPVQAVKLGC
ncbi:MAG: DUF1223 domain-containing protein [Caldimonas sp.]